MFFFSNHIPVGFKTFNDVGRLACGRPRFSVVIVVVVVVVVVNIVDVAGLLFDESSCE